MMDPSRDHHEIPEPLAGAIREAFGTASEVPQRIDEAVTTATSAKFTRRTRPAWRVPAAVGGMLAAAAAIAFILTVPIGTNPNDRNRDGSVDVLDALLLAREGDGAGAQQLMGEIVLLDRSAG